MNALLLALLIGAPIHDITPGGGSSYVSDLGVATGSINMSGGDLTNVDDISMDDLTADDLIATTTGGTIDLTSGTNGGISICNAAKTICRTLTATNVDAGLNVGAGVYGNRLDLINGSTQKGFGNEGYGWGVASDRQFLFCDGTNCDGASLDAGIKRNASAIVELTDGSSGQGSLILDELRGHASTGTRFDLSVGTSGQFQIQKADGSSGRTISIDANGLVFSNYVTAANFSVNTGSTQKALGYQDHGFGAASDRFFFWCDASNCNGANFDTALGRLAAAGITIGNKAGAGVGLLSGTDTLTLKTFDNSTTADLTLDDLNADDLVGAATGVTLDLTSGTDGRLNICNAAKSTCYGLTASTSPAGLQSSTYLGAPQFDVFNGATKKMSVTNSGFSGADIAVTSDTDLVWGSTTDLGTSSADASLHRGAAGVVKVGDGVGGYGDISAKDHITDTVAGSSSRGYYVDSGKTLGIKGSGSGGLTFTSGGGNMTFGSGNLSFNTGNGMTLFAGFLNNGSTTGATSAGTAITSGGTNDYQWRYQHQLNDAGAAGGTDTYRMAKYELTTTDITGWNNVYFADWLDDGTSVISLKQNGNITTTGDLVAGATGATLDLTSGTNGRLNICNAAKSDCAGLSTSSGVLRTASHLNVESTIASVNSSNETLAQIASNGLSLTSDDFIRWFSSTTVVTGAYDLFLKRVAAGKMSLDNGTVGVTFSLGTDTLTLRNLADGADGTLAVGAFSASGVSSLTGGAKLPVQTAATPSAPATCDAAAKGRMEVVDDNDDTAGTQVCYCGMTDDSTYDWLNIADNSACTFY